MFDTIEKDKRFQCSSEFGLYRYDSENDCYSLKNKRRRIGFHYFVVLLTSVIVLLAICGVTYNYLSESTKQEVDHNNHNFSNNDHHNITIQPPLLEMTDEKQSTVDNTENIGVVSSPPILSYPTPEALELRRKSDGPRPFMYEIRDPIPVGFQFPTSNDQNYQAQNVNPHRHRAKNIQEIIKLLEQSQDDNGVVNKKKNPRRRGNNASYSQDPFFPYKPQNPSDINLLATNNFRFAPSVQVDVKKTPVNEQYPKFESLQPEIPVTLTLDVQNNQQYTNKRHKKQKQINYNNLYNQNNYFNQLNRFHQNRIQPYWNNRPYWNVANLNRKHKQTYSPNPHPMIVHLNLYPKKKKKHSEKDQRIGETNIHQNCTDIWEDEKFSQIKNASEFNQLLEKVRHSYLDQSNDKVTINDNEIRIKNTFLQLDKPEDDKMNEIKYLPTDNTEIDENIDVQKSIGFTVINPNFSSINQQPIQSQWRPIVIDDNNYGLEVGEVNDNINDNDETVTLPLPNDVYQKYFNTKPTPKYLNNWDYDSIQENPNLANHRPSFEDGRDE